MYNFHHFTLPFKTMRTISNSIDTMSAQILLEIRIESAYQMTKLLFSIYAYFTIYHTISCISACEMLPVSVCCN